MLALQALAQLLRNNPPAVAGDVIAELRAAAAAGDAGGDGDDEEALDAAPTHHRAVAPSASLTHSEITAALAQVRDAIDRAIDCADAEHLRRTQGGLPSLLLHASAEAAGDDELSAALGALEACADPAESAAGALLDVLAEFAGGVEGYGVAVDASLAAFLRELARATEQQNPAAAERTCTGAAARLTSLVDELMRAVLSLLARLPPLALRLEAARCDAAGTADEHGPSLREARRRAEVAAEHGRGLTPAGTAELARRLDRLISEADRGAFARGAARRARRRRSSASDDEDAQAVPLGGLALSSLLAAPLARDVADETLPDDTRDAAAAVVLKVESEARAEHAAIVQKVSGGRGKTTWVREVACVRVRLLLLSVMLPRPPPRHRSRPACSPPRQTATPHLPALHTLAAPSRPRRASPTPNARASLPSWMQTRRASQLR